MEMGVGGPGFEKEKEGTVQAGDVTTHLGGGVFGVGNGRRLRGARLRRGVRRCFEQARDVPGFGLETSGIW